MVFSGRTYSSRPAVPGSSRKLPPIVPPVSDLNPLANVPCRVTTSSRGPPPWIFLSRWSEKFRLNIPVDSPPRNVPPVFYFSPFQFRPRESFLPRHIRCSSVLSIPSMTPTLAGDVCQTFLALGMVPLHEDSVFFFSGLVRGFFRPSQCPQDFFTFRGPPIFLSRFFLSLPHAASPKLIQFLLSFLSFWSAVSSSFPVNVAVILGR